MLSFNVTVRKGDSLDNMAKSLGLPQDILLKANKGTSAPTLYSIDTSYSDRAQARLLPHGF